MIQGSKIPSGCKMTGSASDIQSRLNKSCPWVPAPRWFAVTGSVQLHSFCLSLPSIQRKSLNVYKPSTVALLHFCQVCSCFLGQRKCLATAVVAYATCFTGGKKKELLFLIALWPYLETQRNKTFLFAVPLYLQ